MRFRRCTFCQLMLALLVGFVCFGTEVLAGKHHDSLTGAHLAAPVSVMQGKAFVCRFQPVLNASHYKIHWQGKTLPLAVAKDEDTVQVLLAAGLQRKKGEYPLVLTFIQDGHKRTVQKTIKVKEGKYPVQCLTLPKKMVNLSKKSLSRHYKEKKEVAKALAALRPGRLWSLPLTRPVPGEVSSLFGLRRFINNQPRSPHRGIDFRGGVGVPIKACAAGVVELVANHYFSGKAVYVNHGQGVMSVYFHMSKVRVHQGQVVSKGEVLGNIGKTGRVTGPHLHFGVYVLGEAVDPLPLIEGRF